MSQQQAAGSHIEWFFVGNFVVPLHNPFDGGDECGQGHTGDVSVLSESAKNLGVGVAVNTSPSSLPEDNIGIVHLGHGLEIRLNHVMTVSNFEDGGRILHFEHRDTEASQQIMAEFELYQEKKFDQHIVCGPHEFIVPGLIDCHIHAAQYAFTGTATDKPLMCEDGWLFKYTFPTERSMADDMTRTRHIYERLVRRTLSEGRSVVYSEQ
jgi:hypothetical protein